MRLLFHDTNIADIEGLCKLSTNPPHLLLLELTLGAECGALKLDLIVTYVGAVGERHAILMPRLTKDLLGDEHFCNLALIVLASLANGVEVSLGALIDNVAHFHDGTLYCVRGTETQRRISAALARRAREDGKQNKRSGVHIVHLDNVEHTIKCKAEHVVMGESNARVALTHGNLNGGIGHGVPLSVCPSWQVKYTTLEC